LYVFSFEAFVYILAQNTLYTHTVFLATNGSPKFSFRTPILCFVVSAPD